MGGYDWMERYNDDDERPIYRGFSRDDDDGHSVGGSGFGGGSYYKHDHTDDGKFGGKKRKSYSLRDIERELGDRRISSFDSYYGGYSRGGWAWSSSDSGVFGKLDSVTCEIARIVNAATTSSAQSSEAVSIRWTNKHDADRSSAECATEMNGNTIVMPSEYVVGNLGNEDNSKKPEIIDGLAGYGLIKGTMKKTCHQDTKDKLRSLRDGFYSKYISEGNSTAAAAKEFSKIPLVQTTAAIEASKAIRDLASNWPGFVPYIARYCSLIGNKVEDVSKYVAAKPDTVSAALAAYNTLITNPTANVDGMSPKMAEVVNKAVSDTISLPLDASGLDVAGSVIETMKRHFVDDTSPPPEGGCGGSGGKGGTGNPADSRMPNDSPSSDTTMLEAGYGACDIEKTSSIELKEAISLSNRPKIPEGCGIPHQIIFLLPCAASKHRFVIEAHKLGSVYADKVSKVTNGAIVDPSCAIEYAKAVAKLKPKIEYVRRNLLFLATAKTSVERALPRGDIDPGSLSELSMKRDPNPRIFERTNVINSPECTVMIMIDASGSMNGAGYVNEYEPGALQCGPSKSKLGTYSVSKYTAAMNLAVVMYEGLRMFSGVRLILQRHNEYGGNIQIMEFQSPEYNGITSVYNTTSGGSNLDSFALESAVNRIAHYGGSKVVFMISDGAPAAHAFSDRSYLSPMHYGGDLAMKHNANVCEWARRKMRTSVFGIGILGEPGCEIGNKMYGKGNFTQVQSVGTCIPIITREISRILAQARK